MTERSMAGACRWRMNTICPTRDAWC